MKGILARKIGMTRILDESGNFVPVTVCQAPKNLVLQVKTEEKDGYFSIVIGADPREKWKNVGKKFKIIREVSCDCEPEAKKGDSISVADFDGVEKVKITGISRGRGFSGVIRRHNFSRGPETHGSHHHREPGSVGMCAKPARILKGKKLPGQYGNSRVTLREVSVVAIDAEKNLIALKGAVPGAKKSFVFIQQGK